MTAGTSALSCLGGRRFSPGLTRFAVCPAGLEYGLDARRQTQRVMGIPEISEGTDGLDKATQMTFFVDSNEFQSLQSQTAHYRLARSQKMPTAALAVVVVSSVSSGPFTPV
jgi:hypothetical protein